MSERDHGGRFDTHIAWLAVVLAFSLPLYRPWVTLSSSLIMILWLVGGALRARAGALRADRLSLSVLLFVALNLLSLIWSDDPRAGFDYLTKYRYLLLVPMIATSVGPAFRRRMVTAFSLAAGFSVVLSWGVFSGVVTLRGVFPGNPAPTMSHIDYSVLVALAALLTLNRILNEELESLWERRREVVVHLSAAAAEGDRSENAEYIYRKKQLRELDRRIGYLQRRLPVLKVVDRIPDTDRVFFGAWVTLGNEDGDEVRYRIVGADEFDPDRNWISVDSPMARALLKHAPDDEVDVDTPKGKATVVIVAVEYL